MELVEEPGGQAQQRLFLRYVCGGWQGGEVLAAAEVVLQPSELHDLVLLIVAVAGNVVSLEIGMTLFKSGRTNHPVL